jgi:hypothetical protein
MMTGQWVMEVCSVVCTRLRRLPTVVNAGPSFSPGSGPGPGSFLFETVGRQASSFPRCARLGITGSVQSTWDQPGGPFWPASVFSTSTLSQSQPPTTLSSPWKVKEKLTGGEKGRNMDTYVVPDL